MNRLADIPVRVAAHVRADNKAGIGGIDAVLHEIAALLDRLGSRGEPGSIDVLSLPLSPGERENLREVLGAGEVQAHMEAQGPSRISETAFTGVWWVEHRARDDSVVAELIEVTFIPEILKSHSSDVTGSAAKIRSFIAARRAPSTPT